MDRRGTPKTDPVDIFDDEDLALAASSLADATEPHSGESIAESSQSSDAPQDAHDDVQGADGDEGGRAELTDASTDAQLDSLPEPTNASLKLRIRPATRARFDSFKADLTVALGGTRLNDSNVGRALVEWFLLEAADHILAEAAASATGLHRPSADDLIANAAFDDSLRALLCRGVIAWAKQTQARSSNT